MAETHTQAAPTRKKVTAKRKKTESSPRSTAHEQTIPVMLRPKISHKECAELIADQLGIKRSQLDPTFYLTGALIAGVERLGKAETIGNWSRKEVAAYLKSAFLPLFELLYEQDELPLVFSLLIARGAPIPLPQPSNGSTIQRAKTEQALPGSIKEQEETYVPLLGSDAEIGLDGFPGGI